MLGLAQLDRDLLDAVEAASPEHQRQIALWATTTACRAARLTEVPWIAEALAALAAGEALPPPFEDPEASWHRLLSDPTVPQSTVRSLDGLVPNMLQQAMAFPAIEAAAAPDPLVAAIDTVYHGLQAFGPPSSRFTAELRGAQA